MFRIILFLLHIPICVCATDSNTILDYFPLSKSDETGAKKVISKGACIMPGPTLGYLLSIDEPSIFQFSKTDKIGENCLYRITIKPAFEHGMCIKIKSIDGGKSFLAHFYFGKNKITKMMDSRSLRPIIQLFRNENIYHKDNKQGSQLALDGNEVAIEYYENSKYRYATDGNYINSLYLSNLLAECYLLTARALGAELGSN